MKKEGNIEDKIKELIENIRPYLNMDGGDIEYIKYDVNKITTNDLKGMNSLLEINCDVYIKDNFVYPLTEEEVNSIITLVRINNHSNNNIVGNIIIKLDNEEIGNINIYKKTQKKRLFSR